MTIKLHVSDDGRRIVVELQAPAPIVDVPGETVDRTPSSRPPPSAPGLAKCADCNIVPLRRTG